MGILINLLLAGLHITLVMIDISLLSIVARILHRLLPRVRWLAAMDDAARPLVAALYEAIDPSGRGLASRGQPIEMAATIWFFGLLLLRFLLGCIAFNLAAFGGYFCLHGH